MHKVSSPEFNFFLEIFTKLHSEIMKVKPHRIVFTGDFNARSINWWCDRESSNEGTQLDMLFSELGLSQMIIEPTHFLEHCKPSCIDLIICDQPNLVIESGVRPSLDQACKHQITFCRLSIKTFRILPFQRFSLAL